jgi:DNA-binding transcriptional LysR family regulator
MSDQPKTSQLLVLQVLALVRTHGNFVRVAEHLNISRSAVTKIVARFEKDVGFKVFRRTTRHVEETIQGAKTIDAAIEFLDSLLSISKESRGTPSAAEALVLSRAA